MHERLVVLREHFDIRPQGIPAAIDDDERAHEAGVDTDLCDGTTMDPEASLPHIAGNGLVRVRHESVDREVIDHGVYVNELDQETTTLMSISTP